MAITPLRWPFGPPISADSTGVPFAFSAASVRLIQSAGKTWSPGRVEEQRLRLDLLRGLVERLRPAGGEGLVGLDEIEEVVGVRDPRPRRAGIGEEGLDAVAVRHVGHGVLAALGVGAAEALLGPVPVVGVEAHDLQRLGEAGERRLLAVVVAAVPFRIELDRRAPDVEPGDEPWRGLRRADHRHDALDHLRMARRPVVGLQRAHRGAGDGMQPADAEAFHQSLLDIDEIADADDREVHAPGLAGVGVHGRRSGGDGAAGHVEVHQRVGGEDEVLVGVDRLARADDPVPVARRLVLRLVLAEGVAVAGEEMRDQDGIGAVGVELARGLPADLHALDRPAAERRVARHLEDLLLDDEGRGGLGLG